MYAPKKQVNQVYDAREIKIMQKAKAYGVAALSNEVLAKELFSLTFHADLDKKKIDELLSLYDSFERTIETAQMSL